MTDEPTSRCRAATAHGRCDYRGTREELRDHADEVGHPRCVVCTDALGMGETQTCQRCEARVRDDLDGVAVAYAHLERVIWETAYRTGRLPGGDALVHVTDGSTERRVHAYEDVKPALHPLAREDDEITLKPIRDEWPNDPLSVLAVLEANERDWRHEFGHGPAEDIATVAGCLSYLREHHWLAARTHPGFDDYATVIRELRSKLEHVVGLADDPVRAPASCFDCGGQLVRAFALPVDTTLIPEHDCSTCGRRHTGRHGDASEGLTDDWTCRGCERIYDQASYFLALRSRRDECQGWVPVKVAASVLRIPASTLFRWAQRGEVEVRRDEGRTFVEWAQVSALREERRSA